MVAGRKASSIELVQGFYLAMWRVFCASVLYPPASPHEVLLFEPARLCQRRRNVRAMLAPGEGLARGVEEAAPQRALDSDEAPFVSATTRGLLDAAQC